MITASLTSSWGVVHIAVERLLVVAYPLKVCCMLAIYLSNILEFTYTEYPQRFHDHFACDFDIYV